MKYNTTNLFASIKDSLNSKKTESGFADFLKLEKNKTYIVRLVPDVENPERTFFPYFSHTWKSNVTGGLINVHCPNTYGEKCPIDEYRSGIYKSKNEKEIERASPLRRNQNTLVKVYVIKDPTNPENEGQVKILRYGEQLNKIITSAVSGDDEEEFGSKVFDLTENGCNLKIKVEENQAEYPVYTSSKFMNPSPIPGLEDTDAIYETVLPLDNIFNHQSYDDILGLLNKHWLGINTDSNSSNSSKNDEDDDEENSSNNQKIDKIFKQAKIDQESNDINFEETSKKPTPTKTTNTSPEDKQMEDILANL